MAPILLNDCRKIRDSDESGIPITTTVLPNYSPGPYTPKLLPDYLKPPGDLLFVPPLAYFCIKSLVQNVDLIDLGGMARVPYHAESHEASLRGLISFFTDELREMDMKYVDPRIWGAIIQIYSSLPPCFATYTLPLSDTHLTTLQAIRSTPDFTFLTILDLSSRSELNDDTIGELKPLTNLCVLDLSRTRVGSWGVKKLSMCLVGEGPGRRGPWRMRLWSLRGCVKVDDTVKDALAKFPLLSAIDLRDTSVTSSTLPGFNSCPPTTYDSFYYPNPPSSWISALSNVFSHCPLFESFTPPYVLHINKLRHPSHARVDRRQVADRDCVLALFPEGRQALHSGHALCEAAESRVKDELRHAVRQRYPSPFPSRSRQDDWDSGLDEHDMLEESGRWDESETSDEDDRYDDFETDMGSPGPFDLAHMGGPWDDDSDDSGNVFPLRYTKADEQTEIARLENARDAAEQRARAFYKASELEGTLRLRGGALMRESGRMKDTSRAHRLSQLLEGRSTAVGQPQRGEASTTGRKVAIAQAIKGEDSERGLMFYREPPPFDYMSANERTAGANPAKRKKWDSEVISVKRKLASDAGGKPHAILNRRVFAASQELHNQGKRRETTGHTLPFRKVQGSSKNENQASASMSMNPFLAKKKAPLHSQVPVSNGGQSSSSAPPGRSAKRLATQTRSAESATLPEMFAAVTSKPRTTDRESNIEPRSQVAVQECMTTDKATGGTTTKRDQGFNMRGWAAKTKRY